MPNSKARYKSYLLRFWQENANAPWRARLESIAKSGEVKHFADAKPLLDLLEQEALNEEDAVESSSS